MTRIEQLYSKAIEIESRSQSPRILKMHSRSKWCQVGIGLTDPETTEYLFVSRNPGGDPELDETQDVQKSVANHQSMSQYLHQGYRHSIALRKFITAFAKERRSTFADESNRFGTTNLSYFYSRTSGELGESFYVELRESLDLLKQELSLPRLKAVVFAGVDQALFFHTLYKTGSRLDELTHVEGKHTWMYSFRTDLISGKRCLVVFMVHPSATRGLTTASLHSLGRRFATLV